jgi:hypothetical protein
MAGTRLYIQSLALVELLVLAAWSFFHGLCQNGDVLCQFPLQVVQKTFQLPSLESPYQLPLIQVEMQLQPNTKVKWRKNPEASLICSEPNSPLVQGQGLWWCPPLNPQDPARVVVRESSLIIFCNESELPGIVMPEIVSPFALSVHLMLEETTDVSHHAQRLALTLQDTVENLKNWPCVDQVSVEMSVAHPYTSRWIVAESASEETGEMVPAYLPALDESQAEQLLESLDPPASDSFGGDLLLYVPAVEPTSAASFQIGDSLLLMVGKWDTSAVSDWLLSKMGIPVEALDHDGSVPAWYDEWYWHQASQQLSTEIQYLFSRVQHLVKEQPELGPSSTAREHYIALKALRNELDHLLRTSRVQSNFPLEHYAAIFAPLLFPLLLPFLVGTIKEIKRYKEKKRSKHGTQGEEKLKEE